MPTASVAPANAAPKAQLIARLRGLAIFAPIALLGNLVGTLVRYPDIGAAIFFPPYAALPYLMITIDSNQSGVHVTLTNAGIGPALIDDIRVQYEGREFKGDPHDFYISQRPGADSALSINKIKPGD